MVSTETAISSAWAEPRAGAPPPNCLLKVHLRDLAPAKPERDDDRRRHEQEDGDRRRERGGLEGERVVEDVELEDVAREVGAALRGRVDVGEHPREHRDQLE